MPVAGNEILDSHIILKAADDTPLSGVTYPANPGVSLALYRQSGTTMVAASEAISWAEIGATGTYYFRFTPTQSGLYFLYLTELTTGSGAGSAGRQIAFRYQVQAAGASFAPSYQNAFCAETDVERYLLQPIDATTRPSDSQVAAWAQGRADVLQTICAGLGSPVTPSTVTAGSRLEGLLREANAIGAALDATVSQTFGTGRQPTEKILSLIAAWTAYAGGYEGAQRRVGFIESEIRTNLASLTTAHVLSGDTSPRAPENAPQDVGLQIRMADLF